MIVSVDAKIVIKRSSTTSEVPTVAPSADHTDGSWTALDIYSGEFFANEADERLFINLGGTIKELLIVGSGGGGIYDGNGTADTDVEVTVDSSIKFIAATGNEIAIGPSVFTPNTILHVKANNGNGVYIDGQSVSASEHIIKLRDVNGVNQSVFRNSGRVDLAINGTGQVTIGGGAATYQFNQLSPTVSTSSLPVAIWQSATKDLLIIRANGVLNAPNLPTSSAGLSAGDIWNNSNVLNIV